MGALSGKTYSKRIFADVERQRGCRSALVSITLPIMIKSEKQEGEMAGGYARMGNKFELTLLVSCLLMSMTVGDDSSSSCGPVTPKSEIVSLLEELQESALATLGPSDFDPKLYVDLPLKYNISDIKQAFRDLPRLANGSISADVLNSFVKKYFGEAGSDVEILVPPDFASEPKDFLVEVKNGDAREWALEVHSLWKQLSRKVSASVGEDPDLHTLLPLPAAVIIPGSRFREVYYWDSYWVIRGLLASKMYETAKGIVNNLISLIHTYGFVLNGARSYYTNRSQPPLLSAMVWAIYNRTGDVLLLRRALPALLEEHKFWNSGFHKIIIRDVHGHEHSLSRYYAEWNTPRPESSTIDKETAKGLTKAQKRSLFREIATAAESGWDFSSRWMGDQKNLTTLHTTSIIPVDLNTFLLQVELNIAFIAKEVGKKSVSKTFIQSSSARRVAIDAILWNDEMGQWLDYWLESFKCEHSQSSGQEPQEVHIWDTRNQNKNIFVSNFFPLWVEAFHLDAARVEEVINNFESSGLLQPGGISTSKLNTGQQWDSPNGWAPVQHIIIEGIAASASRRGKVLAEDIARRWLRNNYATFKSTGNMHEKYDVESCGKFGGGGEYKPQTGFGWSNGVVLALLEEFGWPADTPIGCK